MFFLTRIHFFWRFLRFWGPDRFLRIGDFGLFLQILRLDHPSDLDGFPRTAHGVDFPESTTSFRRVLRNVTTTPQKNSIRCHSSLDPRERDVEVMFFGGGTMRFVAITDEGGCVFLQGLGAHFFGIRRMSKK
jgi:hypothetical protein